MVPPGGISGSTLLMQATLPIRLVPNRSFQSCLVSSRIDLNGELAAFSLFVTGKEPEADRITLETFQRHLLRELRDTGFEPAFGLLGLTERPLVATINFAPPVEKADKIHVALADRCFAASYFRCQDLA